MSNNQKSTTTDPPTTLPIRERLAAMRNEPDIRVVPVDGLGDVRIRRLTAGRGNALIEDYGDDSGFAMVVECLLDEHDKPVYSDVDELRREYWPLVQKLVRACNSVNLLDVKAAEKK